MGDGPQFGDVGGGDSEFDAMDTDNSDYSTDDSGAVVNDLTTEEMISVRETGKEEETERKGEIEESESVTFFPPAYLQRYRRVHEVLLDSLESSKYKGMYSTTGKTVMEVGCAEFGMLPHLKCLLDIGKILFVDLDQQLLEEKLHYLKPLPAEYLQRISRPEALVVEAYAGCVTKVDPDLHRQNPNIFAVVGIEIIEHLHADVLRGFEETVFGIISPHIVIVTTPNSDFNEVFKLPPGKFRHWDHKFEWSRKEFQLWCDKIVCEFNGYMYRIEGICEGPEETKHLGCVSQMAVFEKRENAEEKDIFPYASRIQSHSYKLLQSVKYPNYIETRTPEQIILNEVKYFIDNFIFSKSMLDQYDEMETKEVKVSFGRLQSVGEIAKASKGDLAFVQSVLEKGGYKTVSGDDGVSLLISVDEYIAANLVADSDSMDDEEELCEDLTELNVNRVIEVDEESWE